MKFVPHGDEAQEREDEKVVSLFEEVYRAARYAGNSEILMKLDQAESDFVTGVQGNVTPEVRAAALEASFKHLAAVQAALESTQSGPIQQDSWKSE